MLSFELLKDHEGPRLFGAPDTLRGFHEILHDVNERSPIILDKEGVFLALAYDVRKAYEGARIKRKPARDEVHAGPLFGVDMLWPVLLLQCRMLRASLGFIDSTKRHQAYAYALEAVVEDALRADFGADSETIHAEYLRVIPEHPGVYDDMTDRISCMQGGPSVSGAPGSRTSSKPWIPCMPSSIKCAPNTVKGVFYRPKRSESQAKTMSP